MTKKIGSLLFIATTLSIIFSACVFTPSSNTSSSENVNNEGTQNQIQQEDQSLLENQILMHPEVVIDDSTVAIMGTLNPIEASKTIASIEAKGVINE